MSFDSPVISRSMSRRTMTVELGRGGVARAPTMTCGGCATAAGAALVGAVCACAIAPQRARNAVVATVAVLFAIGRIPLEEQSTVAVRRAGVVSRRCDAPRESNSAGLYQSPPQGQRAPSSAPWVLVASFIDRGRRTVRSLDPTRRPCVEWRPSVESVREVVPGVGRPSAARRLTSKTLLRMSSRR